jgi:hypothetical protein
MAKWFLAWCQNNSTGSFLNCLNQDSQDFKIHRIKSKYLKYRTHSENLIILPILVQTIFFKRQGLHIRRDFFRSLIEFTLNNQLVTYFSTLKLSESGLTGFQDSQDKN